MSEENNEKEFNIRKSVQEDFISGVWSEKVLVVTQDYGVAALALGKGAYCIHQSGKIFTNDNIDGLLMDRHLAKKLRMSKSKHHLKGPKKRTKDDDVRFEIAFRKLISEVLL